MQKNNPEEMIRRQLLLIQKYFPSSTLSEEEIKIKIVETLETKIEPLVSHITSFNYPNEFSEKVLKLSSFPTENKKEEKWLNEFAQRVSSGHMMCFHTFTKEEAFKIKLSFVELKSTLNAIQKAVPFIRITVAHDLKDGVLRFGAFDNNMEHYNLVKTIGNYD